MFKLSRMASLEPSEEVFEPRDPGDIMLRWDVGAPPGEGERVRLRFPARQEYLVIDLFGTEGYTALPEGGLEAVFYSNDLDDVLALILGMSSAVEVVEPEALRQKLADWARAILERYDGGEGKA
jgi:predicted DNA-binding transcriptional regulator YafY